MRFTESSSAVAVRRGAAKAEIPMLAIGSGARLVARALGGEISPCSERGVVNAKLNAVGREEPLFAGQPWTCEQAVWNDECVTKLPEGAKAFGSTPSAKFAAWGLGPWIVAIDWHPEWDAKEIAECAHSKEIAECAHSQGAISAATVSSIERLGRLFAERVSIILMPVDRMSSGRVRD